ncbi:MAG: shikimate dehydrogenase family protein, partial [Caulobacteraceae bacterium]
MTAPISGTTLVAGVAGAPVAHSLSPAIHNAWIAAAGIDAVYVAFAPPVERFEAFSRGLRGGAVRGLSITAPFKAAALALADRASDGARRAGAANLLLFAGEETIEADNTDGVGLRAAPASQAPGFRPGDGAAVVLGAGGAVAGAAAALLEAGDPEIRLVNRSEARGRVLEET